jgi:hypothetical protein
MAEGGKSDSVNAKQKVAKCMVFGDLMLRNVEAEHTDMMVECFQGIYNRTATHSDIKGASS